MGTVTNSKLFAFFTIFLCLDGFLIGATSVTPVDNISAADISRIKTVLAKAWNLSDAPNVGFAVLSYSILNLEVPKPQEVCNFLKNGLKTLGETKLEPIYVISSAITKISGCKLEPFQPNLKQKLEKFAKEGTSQEIFFAIGTLKNKGEKLDSAKISESLQAAIKKDDSALSVGYALWAIAETFTKGQQIDIWTKAAGNVLSLADEVDKTNLQFEGGLSVSAVVLNGIYRLAEVSNQKPSLSKEEAIKFGNYLVSRKTVITPRSVWLFTSSLDIVSRNKFIRPVWIGFPSSNVLTESNKKLNVQATDLFGRAFSTDIAIVLDSVKDSNNKELADIKFIKAVPSSDKKSQYLDFSSKSSLHGGFYQCTFSGSSPRNDASLIFAPKTLELKVLRKMGAVTAKIGIAESDQQAKTKWIDVKKGEKLPSKLELESSQKLIVKISSSEQLHQEFVLLRNLETKREITFVATPEGNGKTDYKFELDLTANAKDLGYKSGVYEMVIYLGDFLVENPVEWNVGPVGLRLPFGTKKAANSLYTITYGPKPEIKMSIMASYLHKIEKINPVFVGEEELAFTCPFIPSKSYTCHLFRQPEPRPPKVLSTTFSVLVLIPILILFGLWMKIGINFRGFPKSSIKSGLLFHGGLAAIFGVYGLFWLKLNMFEAIKWMAVPGLITFLAGHRLLSNMAESRKS